MNKRYYSTGFVRDVEVIQETADMAVCSLYLVRK
jgi:hypothetical protein